MKVNNLINGIILIILVSLIFIIFINMSIDKEHRKLACQSIGFDKVISSSCNYYCVDNQGNIQKVIFSCEDTKCRAYKLK